MNVNDIRFNENNPRKIGKEKFKKLVKSIKKFPEMLNLRPIVINSQGVVIGGNMRLKACIEAGLKDVPVITAELTEAQEQEFVIKDNLSYGAWDYEALAQNWEIPLIKQWGISLPKELLNIKTFKDEQRYDIIAECDTEEERLKLLDEFRDRGIECRNL